MKPLLSEAKNGAEKIRFLALYWVTSDYTGVPNKLLTQCIENIVYEKFSQARSLCHI